MLPVLLESDIEEPDVPGLVMVEPELFDPEFIVPLVVPLVRVVRAVDGVVIVLASVVRRVLGVVGMPLFVVDEPVGAADPGTVVPVVDGFCAVGLVVDGLPVALPVAPPVEVWAWANPTAPTRAAIEAAAVSDWVYRFMDCSCSNG
ncbi:MAG: hypothetical protein ABIX46_05215 [Burkholderiaceae bacterium]